MNLSKLLAPFGNKRRIKSENTEHYIQDIIDSVEEEPFAISEENVIYASTKELGGYYYVITITVGVFKIKTKKGAHLSIEGDNFNLDLKSDMDEFESDYSNVAKRYITRIDFQIDKEDAEKFQKENINLLELTAKKHIIVFKTLQLKS